MDSNLNVVSLKSNNKIITTKAGTKNSDKKPLFGFLSKIVGTKNKDVKDNQDDDLVAGSDKPTLEANVDCNTIKNKGGNFTNFFKIKQVRTSLIVLIFSVIALIILSSYNSSNSKSATTSNSNYMTSLEYCEKLENKLMEVLGDISGVGNISVMVSVESGPEIKVATSTDEKTNTTTNGSNTTTTSTIVSDPIIINSSGSNSALVLSEIAPKVTGVIVVASGAKDVKVRLNLLEAIEALLNVSSENIQIYY